MSQQKIENVNSIFDSYYLESKNYYMYCYQQIPCITWIDRIDADKVLAYLKSEYAGAITDIHQHSKYSRARNKALFKATVLLLKDNVLIELGSDYCEILHSSADQAMAEALVKELSRFRRREKRKSFEINLISKDYYGLELKSMPVKKTSLDLGLFYEDAFVETDRIIRERLNKKEDKGIVLLHGLPGTGKTTYLRNLIGKLKKKVLLLSPAIAGNIMNPELMDLLIDNPDSVLIIEDAENIVLDRRISDNPSMSNLLNISDGLLADFLNVQVICTFNQPLTMVDSALMRKGRLIAQYKFDRLSVEKAQNLSSYLGFARVIKTPMTIAEITNQHEKDYQSSSIEVLGFRRHLAEN